MNRQDMQEQIELYVPSLAEEQKERWKNVEKMRQAFVRDYSPAKIKAMRLDDYVIGKGAENPSFCYRIERETDDLGRILGATAFKFGVYYGKTRSDPIMQYRFRDKWGNNAEDAFTAVKEEILALLQSAASKDIHALNQNRLSPMFKGKILFVYHPDEYMPIYSQEHLNFFIAELNLHANPNSGVEMQRALMAYRATWPMLMEHSAVLFMHFLYQIFPQVKLPSAPATETPALPLLDQAIAGAEFIEQMPPVSVSQGKRTTTTPKIDYIEQQKQRKRIGNRGEAIVLGMEEKRLQNEGKPDLAKKIQHVSDNSDRDGYDILSFEVDGRARHIEVKATTAGNLDRGFYISANELEKAKTLGNYYIYFVFSAMSKNPKVLLIKEPNLQSAYYNMEPVSYHVTIKSHAGTE